MAPPLHTLWQARTARERTAIGFGAVVVAGLLLYGFVWEPWRVQQARLREYLPRLRAQATQFTADATEAQRLRERARITPAGDQPRAAIESAAVETGMRAQLESITELARDRFQVVLDPVAYDAFVRWTGALAARAVAVESVQLRAGATPGTIAVDSLVLKGRGGAP